ncbi:MAG: nuclear transport factor 2 family protein [Rhodothermales bacterium]|nr:nuclear transport factor 2 family protein [Rhodothermales bacterium]
MTTPTAMQLAMDWINAWTTGDLTLLKLAPDFSHTSPFGTIEGREKYLDIIIPAAKQNVTRLEFQEIIADENRAVIRFLAVGPDGTTPTSEWIYAENGEIKSIVSYYDQGSKRLATGEKSY